jgi:hypothetical protein
MAFFKSVVSWPTAGLPTILWEDLPTNLWEDLPTAVRVDVKCSPSPFTTTPPPASPTDDLCDAHRKE